MAETIHDSKGWVCAYICVHKCTSSNSALKTYLGMVEYFGRFDSSFIFTKEGRNKGKKVVEEVRLLKYTTQ